MNTFFRVIVRYQVFETAFYHAKPRSRKERSFNKFCNLEKVSARKDYFMQGLK